MGQSAPSSAVMAPRESVGGAGDDEPVTPERNWIGWRADHWRNEIVASIQTLQRPIAALEARLADIEGGYGDTLYRLQRASVKSDVRMGRILDHLKIADVTDDEVDAAIDHE